MTDDQKLPATPSSTSTKGFVEIGKIVAAQGLNGEVRVYPDSDFPERFIDPGERWILRPSDAVPQPIKLLRGRYLDGKGLYVLRLDGVVDRTQAEALKDARLLVPEGDRPPLGEDEFHVLDLIGLAVIDQATQTLIGHVAQIISAGNDLLEVERAANQAAVLIPFVKAIVPVVDLPNRRIEITPPAGLIEP